MYDKVGESTEVALTVLVEKLNVTGIDIDKWTKSERANACNNTLKSQYKKVSISPII